MMEKTQQSFTTSAIQLDANQFAFSFRCEPDDILDLFEEISKQLGFQLIQREPTFSTAIRKANQKSGIYKMMDCFGCLAHQGVTAIKLNLSKIIKPNTMKSQMIGQIKGLAGMSFQVKNFISTFSSQMQKQGYSFASDHVILQGTDFAANVMQKENPYYLEACSQHIVSNLLLNQQYDLYHTYARALQDYNNTFKNIEESISLLPMPIKHAITSITELQDSMEKLLQKLNYPSEIFPFAKISVQQHFFGKIQSHLYSIYDAKNLQTQIWFQKKKNLILKTYSVKDILSEVCLNQKFWSVDKSRMDQILPLKQLREVVKFSAACRQLQKMVFTFNPREKIKHCQLAYTYLKNHFYDYSNGKYELNSMQDIIPIWIVIVLLLQIGSLRSELDIMLQFANHDPQDMQAQKRLLINVSESYNYVVRDWNLPQ